MRGLLLAICVFSSGCASHEVQPRDASRLPSDWRCVLRISPRGTMVDGERVTRSQAVDRCKRAPGGAVVVVEDEPTTVANADGYAVVVEDVRTRGEWETTRAALQREGVQIHLQGALCNLPGRYACRPRIPAKAITREPPKRVAAPPVKVLDVVSPVEPRD